MKHARLREQLRRIRDAKAQVRHVGVIEYPVDATQVERDALVAEAKAAGRIADGFGVLLVPADLPLDEWERRQRERPKTP
jgi:hypothetical protein